MNLTTTSETGFLRRYTTFIMATAIIAAIAYCALKGRSAADIAFRPSVQSLERLAKIVALRVHLADTLSVDAREGMNKLKGAWIVKGDALIAVDASRASIKEIDETSKTAVIVLPPPEVLSPRVDHDRTRTFNLDRSLFTDSEYVSYINDKAMRLAQQRINEQAALPEHFNLAKAGVEKIVAGFYSLAGWNVRVEWADQPGGKHD